MKIKHLLVSIFMFSIILWASFAQDRNLPWIDLITRKERWADETRRYAEQPLYQSMLQSRTAWKQKLEDMKQHNFRAYLKEKEKSYHKELANEYLMSNYGDEYSIDSQNKLYQGHELRQTESFKNNKTKIIIHHTADATSFSNKSDVLHYLQKTYRFHAFTRWRGDIGYNFLIDPFGNIYEWRAGWEDIIATHTLRNNTPSLWIALMWNFEIQKPSTAQLKSLVQLLTALTQKYNINPLWKTYYHRKSSTAPYLETLLNYTIAGHTDAGYTACPGKNLYKLLPNIRTLVKKKLAITPRLVVSDTHENQTTHKIKTKNQKFSSLSMDLLQNDKFTTVLKNRKSLYFQKHPLKRPKTFKKVTHNITINEAKHYLEQKAHVLLYDLSQKFDTRELSCTHDCSFVLDHKIFHAKQGRVKNLDTKLSLSIGKDTYYWSHLSVSSDDNLISIDNYKRKSYAGIPRNTFKWTILFDQEKIYSKTHKNFEKKYVLINILDFDDYLKWIVETNDSETIEKNKVMAMIAKTYALFYMNADNIHPNIPQWVHYNAIDDPDLFQKYVGAWLEKTLHKRYTALEQTKNILVTYQWYIPLLPYFSCSAGFTQNAKDIWWRSDTPYLSSKLDFASCNTFQGHGVWLSWKGAERRAKQWREWKQILRYYYDGIDITQI